MTALRLASALRLWVFLAAIILVPFATFAYDGHDTTTVTCYTSRERVGPTIERVGPTMDNC